ncbi:unnamed product, partial [Ostreococcus tauri]
MNTDPTKLPTYESTHDRATCVAFTAPSSAPLVITNTFPVNNSAPVRTTMVSPAGSPIAPLTNALNPGFDAAKPGDAPPTHVMSSAPRPMSAPAVNPSVTVVSTACAAFFALAATAASNTAGGATASARGT